MKIRSLTLKRIGPIKKAEVKFGDLTVLVGPQATGKSIFPQFLKLVADKRNIHEKLRRHGIDGSRISTSQTPRTSRRPWTMQAPSNRIRIHGELHILVLLTNVMCNICVK